jgi:hypothetical protein
VLLQVNNQIYTAATAQERKEMNAAFLAHLFMTHPGLRMRNGTGVQEVAVMEAATDHLYHEWTEHVRPFLSVVARGELGDTKSSLGDAKSSLGDAESSRWVTLRARWVTLELAG